jgi:hypothetical protein
VQRVSFAVAVSACSRPRTARDCSSLPDQAFATASPLREAAQDWLRGAERAMCVSARRRAERYHERSIFTHAGRQNLRRNRGFGRALYDTEPPPRISRELLTRAIACRLQEREFGGLAPAARRLLERVAGDLSSHRAKPNLARKAAPGTLLIREWRGKAHQVTVHNDGVVYRGKRYRSLSEVARLITGTRWSGPLFFGLRKPVGEARHGAA